MENDKRFTDANAKVKSWLYHLLGDLEIQDVLEANKSEQNNRKVVIEIQFKG
jgi:hypothetical protein